MFAPTTSDFDSVIRVMRQHAAVARIAFDNGDYHAALRNLNYVLSHLEQGPNVFNDDEYALFQRLAAKIYLALKMPNEADFAIRTALKLHTQDNLLTTDVLSDKRHLAEAFRLRMRFDEAEALYRECISSASACPGAQLEGAKSYMGLGQVLIDSGKLDQAERALGQALTRMEAAPSSKRFWYGRCLMSMARLRFMQGKAQEAKAILEEGLGVIEPLIGPDHPLRVKGLQGMGRILQAAGQSDASQKMFAECADVEHFLKLHDL
jgi:tetratricopeptide (TPR) repeat protein